MNKNVDGLVFYQSKEFQALCKRFGIDWEKKTTKLQITIDINSIVTVIQNYNAENIVES